MIQRIQSFYLLLITALLIAVLFLPFGVFQTPDEMFEYTAFSIKQVGAGEVYHLPVWILAVLSMVGAVVSFVTIFLYKKRKVQMRLCQFNLFIVVGLCLICGGFVYSVQSGLNACFVPKVGLLFLPLAIVFNPLALQAIRKDESLVKSWDRIR